MAEPSPYPGTPRWVKVFGIMAAVVAILFVILMLTRGPGGHGPNRHMTSSGIIEKPLFHAGLRS